MSTINFNNVDCMDFMKTIPDKYYNLAIVDPEYGIGASRPSKKNSKCKQKNGTYINIELSNYAQKDWDNKPAQKKYFDELFRISRNQIIWGVNYYDYKFTSGRLVWDKLNYESDQMDCEIAYCSLNNRTDLFYFMWAGMMQGTYCGKDIRKAIIQQGNKQLNEKRIHPTQKPVIIYRYILQKYANEGDKIIDTHGGSMSSAIACDMEGYDLDICELDEEYFNAAVQRFNMYKRQLTLF